jgi:hypothetical protein
MLEEVLAMPHGALRDEDDRQTVGTWTSLADVQIMVIMASELGMGDDAETLDYGTVGELLSALDERGVFG